MTIDSGLHRERSDAYVASLLASACIVLYIFIFSVVFFLGSANGVSLEKMLALNQVGTSDVTEYINLAHSMLEQGQFSLPDSGTEFLRVPGYPVFLALVLLIFRTLIVVPLLQILITACTVALIYLIGVRYFPRPVAIAAAAIYMIDPIVIYAAWVPISEPLFMLFLMGSVYAIGVEARRVWVPFAAAGILLAISVYMRPIGLYVAPIIACMALAREQSWRTAIRNIAVFFIALICLISPWMVRNYILSGHFAFSSTGSYGLYANNMPLFEQVRTGTSYLALQKKFNERFGTNDEHILRSFKYADEEVAIAHEVLLAHPFQYMLFHLFKSAQLFVGSSIVNVTYHMHQFGILSGEHAQGEGAWGMLTQHKYRDAFIQTFTHIPRLIERILWALIYVSALYATIRAIRRRSAHVSWIVCAFILLNAFAILTGPVSDDTRYRMPLEPFLLLLGCFGAYTVWLHIRGKGEERIV
ncbi:MAG: glycosyltransferase family 39 protein [bacterium]|nr:glycosyltransferase family 39 protein [bacterium]